MATVFLTESSKNIGGQELQLLQQALYLKAEGHTPFVICRSGSRIEQEAVALELNTETVEFRNVLYWPSIKRFANLLMLHRPVSVICHSGHDSNLSAIVVRLLGFIGFLNPRPSLIRMRTYQPSKAKAFTYNILFDRCYTPSEALRRQLLKNKRIKPEKVEVLYPGIDFKKIQRDALQSVPVEILSKLHPLGARQVVLHPAMLRAEKGHRFMLNVINHLKHDFPEVLYVIAGEGDLLLSLVEEVYKLDLNSYVCFVGMVKPLAPLIALSDVVVMPSLYEPLGMSQIEALGLGIPVVVSDAGGLPETVIHNETGKICPTPEKPDSFDRWVDALSIYLSNRQLAKKHAEKGREVVTRQFDVSTNIQKLLSAVHPSD